MINNNSCCHMLFCRNPSLGSSAEQLDELSIVGFPEEPEVSSIFESSGMFTVFFSLLV